jgi:hypothetical protein
MIPTALHVNGNKAHQAVMHLQRSEAAFSNLKVASPQLLIGASTSVLPAWSSSGYYKNALPATLYQHQ